MKPTTKEAGMADYLSLPDDLPVPADDGAADHLPHISMPHLTLHATDGATSRSTGSAMERV